MRLLTDAKKNFDKNIKSIFNDINMRLGDCLSLLEIQLFDLIIFILILCLTLTKVHYPQKENSF